MSKITNEQFNELIDVWSKDHVLAIESLFDVELTDQQKNLVRLSNDQSARVAVASCTGSGKTAILSMMTFLYLMVLPDCRILITSPSFNQLVRVFYSELCKWHKRMPLEFQSYFSITREKVEYTATKRYIQFASLVTASVENKESLQGGHADNYIIFGDEASGISEDAFDILLGTLSTGKGGRFILVSNPVRPSGRFYDIFNTDLGSWDKLHFSAYDSPNVNKEWIEEMKDTYGEDSDLFRMRVLGQFPRVGINQFISTNVVEDCITNDLPLNSFYNYPKLMGVDVARFGDDSTVLIVRQGPKVIDMQVYKNLDTMEVSGKVMEFQAKHQCSCIFIDSIGVGSGVFDRCKELRLPVKEVVVSTKSSEPATYCDMRSQLWGHMRNWLNNGADLPGYCRESGDRNLFAQLIAMEYTYNKRMQIQLISKKDLKRAGKPSPDIADALALTFAEGVYTAGSHKFMKKRVRRSNYLWV